MGDILWGTLNRQKKCWTGVMELDEDSVSFEWLNYLLVTFLLRPTDPKYKSFY